MYTIRVVLLLCCSFVCLHAANIVANVSTIAQALASVQDGDVLILQSGTYPNLNFTVYGLSLSVMSESGNPADVIINGQGYNQWSPFEVMYNSNLTTLPAKLNTTLSISGISFINCGSSHTDEIEWAGGAVYVLGYNTSTTNVTISNCVFNGGFSDWGGAIYAGGIDSDVYIQIYNTSFLGTEGIYGAALYLEQYVQATIKGCTFNNLLLLYGGGVFMTPGAVLYLSDSNFTNGIAGEGDTDELEGGGVVYTLANTNAIIDNIYVYNNAGSTAGSIITAGDLTLTNSNFTDNLGGDAGGAVATVGGHITIVGCTFVSNQADINGGALYHEGSEVTISQCTFNANNVIDGGGAVTFLESIATITGCTFTASVAETGGALLVDYGSDVQITDSTLTLNVATEIGGAIYVGEDSRVIFTGGNINDNEATSAGGGIFIDFGGSLVLQACAIAENAVAKGNGASIYCIGGSMEVDYSYVYTSTALTDEKNGVYCDTAVPANSCTLTNNNTMITSSSSTTGGVTTGSQTTNSTSGGGMSMTSSTSGSGSTTGMMQPTASPFTPTTDWTDVCINHTGGGGKKKSGHIPGWGVALIVIFVLGAVGAIAGLTFYIIKKKKTKPTSFARM